MFIQAIPRKGHKYYAIYEGKRINGKVTRKTKLYLGSLENIDEPKRLEFEEKIKKLDEPTLITKFRSVIVSLGYKLPSSLTDISVEETFDYGRELAFHKVCEEIDFVNIVDKFSNKGGGPSIGKVVEAMSINRNCDPCSYFRLQEWYSRSSLPIFLKFPCTELTYDVCLNALDYLQPENTIKMQAAIYENIRKVYHYDCDRLDIDLTSTYFEGNKCILASFGYSRDHRPDRPQIVIAFIVDQKGVLVTHRVWPGNQSDAKSLEPIDDCLTQKFKLDAPRVMDRGIATWANLDYMDKNGERYLVAIRAKIKSTGFLNEIGIPSEKWVDVGENEVGASIVKDKRKYIITWNSSVAATNRKEREARVEKAEKELIKIQDAVSRGRIDSRKKRDEKIGHIKSKFGVTRYINTKGDKKGFGFSMKRSNAFIDAKNYDGYQIFATTEFDLTEKDVVESYRTRDQIEKAIQTLKCALSLHPQYVRTTEHVLGNIFVCSMAYQLRSILKMKLKNNKICMSVDDAMAVLERLKEVEIVIGKGDVIEVRRKLGGVNCESRTLIDVFNMATNGILPGVDQ